MDEEMNDGIETITFDDLCRLCISQRKFVEITSSPDIDKPMYSDIMMLLSDNVKIVKFDKLPTGICEECAIKLLHFYEFRIQIETSYVELNNLIERNEAKDTEYESFTSEGYITEKDKVENILKSSEISNNKSIKPEEVSHHEYFSSVESSVDNSVDFQTTAEFKEKIMVDALNEYENEDYMQSKNYGSFLAHDNSSNNIVTGDDSMKNDPLSPDEQVLWQKKLSFWIQNQEKRKQKKYSKIHKEKKTIQCTICEKIFSHPYKLKAHMNIHYGIKYECGECKKLFLSESNLKEHTQAIHLKLKQFGCDKCGRIFNKKHTLVKHLRVHSDETLYQCPHCPKSFKWKTSLDPHILSHTGEKPFQCQLCDKTYSADSGLRKHCRRFHDGEGIKSRKDTDYQTIYIQAD